MVAPIHGKQQVALADFEALIAPPENRERALEFISGEIAEAPSYPLASALAAQIVDTNCTLGGAALPGLSTLAKDIFLPASPASQSEAETKRDLTAN